MTVTGTSRAGAMRRDGLGRRSRGFCVGVGVSVTGAMVAGGDYGSVNPDVLRATAVAARAHRVAAGSGLRLPRPAPTPRRHTRPRRRRVSVETRAAGRVLGAARTNEHLQHRRAEAGAARPGAG